MAGNSVQPPHISHDEPAKQMGQNSSNQPQAAPAAPAAPAVPVAPSPPAIASGSKGKKAIKTTKKAPDANETGKLLAAKINQLELNAADEKDQEQEIGMLL